MFKLLNPVFIFIFFQTLPLVIFIMLDNVTIKKLLQGYEVANFGVLSILIYLFSIFSFILGYIISKHVKLNFKKIKQSELEFIKRPAIIMTAISISFLLYIIINNYSFLDLIQIIVASTANQFKSVVYTSGLVGLLIFRHLVILLTTIYFIKLYNLNINDKKLLIFIMISIIPLFLFTSSRLTVISFFIIFLVFFLNTKKITTSSVVKIFLILLLIIFIFALGIYFRSITTWQNVSGNTGILTPILYEIGAYFISPVNYTVAFIEESLPFIQNGYTFLLPFVFSVLNIHIDSNYLNTISSFYNPSLNQIGIISQAYINHGYFLLVFFILYGYISGIFYRYFINKDLIGLLLYPIIYISLFDSVRGFLLMQNILAANILFIIFFHFVYKYLTKKPSYKE